MNKQKRLGAIAAENRAMACDGAVPKTIEMLSDFDIGRIYKLATTQQTTELKK